MCCFMMSPHSILKTEFVRKYELEDFIVVADSGLMNNDNIADLEANGYKYIIGAKIKNESRKIQEWILEQPKTDATDRGYWSDIRKTVPERMLITGRKGYAVWRRHTTEVLLPKTISTSAATTSS